MEELKPCPFCGGEAKLMKMGYPHWVYCEDCGARVHGRVVGEVDGERASIEAWNRRVEDGSESETRREKELAEAERKGAEEAWRLARKIDASAYLVDEGYERGLTREELDEVYGDIEYIYNLSCEEALEKYRAWERKIDGKEV